MIRPLAFLGRHADILGNTGTLIGSGLVTSGMGFVFWFVVARLFDAHHVGLASAAVAAMLMLSTLGIAGLDALLVGELAARSEGRGADGRGGLLSAGVLAAFVSATALGLLFAAPIRWLSPGSNLGIFFAPGVGTYLLFALGVGLTGATYVFDRATIGLLRGGIQLLRNAVFSVVRLLALPLLLLPLFASQRMGEAIYGLWAVTTLVSLLLVLPRLLRSLRGESLAPAWAALMRLRSAAWGNHLLNLAQHGPSLLYPVIVALLVSPAVNAAFYIAWMLITFAYSLPVHLTAVLHAVGARDPDLLAEKLGVTLRLSGLAAAGSAVVLGLLADPLLGLFGPEYAAGAGAALRILALGVLPMAIKVHYFTLARITGFTRRAAAVGGALGLVELVAVYLGARSGSLGLMSWALLAVLVVEALLLAPVVIRYLRGAGRTMTARS